MTLLTKAQIFACEDIRSKIVSVPEWGGDMKIRTLSIADQIEFEKSNKNKKHDSDAIFTMLTLCCVNEEGNRMFDKQDLEALQSKSSAAILRVFKECLDLNSLNDGDLEKQAKNS